ncbi:MAG: hypothetical protein Pg6C_11570 [Treponemataceae bacterium]|nr:MAG: hypothetical protein Pg6C_11570 [Treponemataceae bacterium]
MDGQKELLGLRIEQNGGAKFWPGVMNELKNRREGGQDILLAAVDGLADFPEAVNAVFPQTEVQLRVVRMARSVRFVPYKDRKAAVAGLKKIYPAPPADLASCAPDGFAGVWDKKYPMISRSWRNRRNGVVPFFKFSPEIRNAVEPVNYTIQKIIKHRQSFPNGGAAVKLIFTGLKKTAQKWTMPIRDWGSALNQFAVIYGEDRVPL